MVGSTGFFNGFSVASNGTFDEVIGGPTSFGTLSAQGASLNGTLEITLQNGFIPAVGQRFAIMSTSGFGSLSGTFANIEGQTFNNETEMWDVVYTPNEVDLVAVPTPEPSTWLLVATGMAALAGSRVYRKTCRRDE